MQLPELQSAQAQVEQQISRLSEALANETRRRESAEQQAKETGQGRSELETQLTQVRQELEASHKQLQGQVESSGVEQARLEALIKDLQAAREAVENKLASLTQTLDRREKSPGRG